jgi:hypothetical protein
MTSQRKRAEYDVLKVENQQLAAEVEEEGTGVRSWD